MGTIKEALIRDPKGNANRHQLRDEEPEDLETNFATQVQTGTEMTTRTIVCPALMKQNSTNVKGLKISTLLGR